MFERIRLSALALVLAGLVAVGLPAGAGAADLWTVSNVAVDGTAASPSAAKDAALARGRARAWTEVFRRLTPSTEWQSQPQLTDEVLEPMIKSFDIANEKHSSTRYLATVTFVFNAASVRDALRKSGIQFSESTAKPVLVIALTGAAWQPESPWGSAWSGQTRKGRLVPVAVPLGDGQDLAALATISTAADWSVVKPLADRYGAGSVLVAAQTRSANGIQVSMTHLRPDSRQPRAQAFARQGTEDEVQLAARAAGSIADALQEDWKRTTSVDFRTQTSLSVMVPFRSLAEWVSMRKVLESTKLVQRAFVEEMNMNVARVRLDYVGKLDQLQTALAQSNIYLAADDKGQWTLSRNASSAAAPSPSPVVP